MKCNHFDFTSFGADILCLDCCSQLVEQGLYHPVVTTSGGYAPIHSGHLSQIKGSAQVVSDSRSFSGGILIVIVNDDAFLEHKHGKAFMPLKVRSEIVSALRWVDVVVPFNASDPADMTVCEALKKIRPHFFTKGGDRKSPEDLPEWAVCQELGVEVVFNIGDEKFWSSSHFLQDWVNFVTGFGDPKILW